MDKGPRSEILQKEKERKEKGERKRVNRRDWGRDTKIGREYSISKWNLQQNSMNRKLGRAHIKDKKQEHSG